MERSLSEEAFLPRRGPSGFKLFSSGVRGVRLPAHRLYPVTPDGRVEPFREPVGAGLLAEGTS